MLLAVLLAGCAPAPPTGIAATPSLAWRRVADIPTPRSEVAAAVHGGLVIVIGGFGGANVVEAYLPQQDRWLALGQLPVGVDHAMAAATVSVGSAASHVYLMGGNVSGVASARVFRGTVSAPGGIMWEEVAAMPGPRSQGAAVAVGTKIYVVGGASGDRLAAPTYEYDAILDTWRAVAAIPTPRDHLSAAELGGRVCAVGGRRLSLLQNLSTLECYDPAGEAWSKLPDAPTARGGVGAAVVGSRLVFVGGEQPLGTFREVEIFDQVTGRWSRGPDLPTPRHGLGVVAVGGTVYVMSGGPTPGGSQTAVCEALDVR